MPHTLSPTIVPRIAVVLLLCLGAAHVQAASIHVCRDAHGATAYQDRPCAPAQSAGEIELAPAPPPAASPQYRVPEHERDGTASRRTHAHAAASAHRREDARAFECRAANGEVFYRLSSCPKSIAVKDAGARSRDGKSSAVSAHAVGAAEACRRMRGSARAGSDRDDRVSTYERNAGRDPCRWL